VVGAHPVGHLRGAEGGAADRGRGGATSHGGEAGSVARMGRRFFQGQRPLCFAHRGGAALWPENTLLAFEGALGLGIEYLEMDLHLSRDGVIVVHHDADLDRTTDGHGPVRDHTLAELKRLDAGYRFNAPDGSSPYRGQGLRIPTLEEVLELSSSAHINVEVKQRGPEIRRALLRLIERHGIDDRIFVAAAHHPIIRDFRRESGGHIATGASAREVLAFWATVRVGRMRPPRSFPFDALQVPVTQPLAPGLPPLVVIDEAFVAAAHAHEIEVHAWVIDRPEEMRRLIAMGVDGVMTDRPDYLVQVARLG
jgi:glycerophosphoryl diester phosphodiesterase